MQVTFFGVRGSCPCSGPQCRRVGGNTSCVLVSVEGEDPLVLDLGTGLRALGEALGPRLRAQGRPLRANALLTHLHLDHILGLPFLGPLHEPGAELTVYGPAQDGASLRDTVAAVLRPPFFPVPLAEFAGTLRFCEVAEGDIKVDGLAVRVARVAHPGTTLGFRIEHGGRSLVYLPDHQAPTDGWGVPDAVLELCDGADLVLHDAQYSEAEFADRATWGHSTVAYAVAVAAQSGARRLLLFHHDPSHSDRDVLQMLRQARRLPDAGRLKDVSVAVEGMTVDLVRA